NTGKFTGTGGNLEATVTSNNLEAAEEIVNQLRLRDIGGIIVIDFIDMVLPSNRELLLRRLVECLGRDRTRHQVAEVTSLGLIQMTRKKIGTGLLEAFGSECPHCLGRGYLVHDAPVDTQKQADGGSRDSRPQNHRPRPGDGVRGDSSRGTNGGRGGGGSRDDSAGNGHGGSGADAPEPSAKDSRAEVESTNGATPSEDGAEQPDRSRSRGRGRRGGRSGSGPDHDQRDGDGQPQSDGQQSSEPSDGREQGPATEQGLTTSQSAPDQVSNRDFYDARERENTAGADTEGANGQAGHSDGDGASSAVPEEQPSSTS
ncbi:MAG TPA: ribonuclease E/G, partial [Propionibacteriaceae bacterium]